MADIKVTDQFKGYSILVVDDEEAIASLMATRMELMGFQATSASSGDEAYDKFRENPVDVIVSDVRMNNGDGVFLAKKLQDAGYSPVIVFVTAFADVTVPQAKAFGVSGIFSKPVDFDSLSSHLQRELAQRSV